MLLLLHIRSVITSGSTSAWSRVRMARVMYFSARSHSSYARASMAASRAQSFDLQGAPAEAVSATPAASKCPHVAPSGPISVEQLLCYAAGPKRSWVIVAISVASNLASSFLSPSRIRHWLCLLWQRRGAMWTYQSACSCAL